MGNTKLQYVQGTPMFTDINKNKKQYPYLTEDIETDICIIGGGVTGAITSYYLSKENIKCVLLEKRRIAHLSTSVTTSLLQYELDDLKFNMDQMTLVVKCPECGAVIPHNNREHDHKED